MLHLVLTAALTAALATPVSDSVVAAAELRREALMAALQSGGYTVMLRHARTDRSFVEATGAVPKERNAQRNLSDDGIRDAALMGVVFRRYHVTFSEIISSPMARTVETAEMAAGVPTTTMLLRTFPATEEQGALVRLAPKPGTNRLIVTHHFVVESHVPGIVPGDVNESEAAVIRHKPDGSIELVGRITLSDWQALANPSATATHAPENVSNANTAHTTPPVAIPDTHAGHLAKAYLDAFNSGSATAMRTFIDSLSVTDPSRSTEVRVQSYLKLFEEFGPFTVVEIESSASTELQLKVHSLKGVILITLKSTDAQPMRTTSVTFAYTGIHR